MQAVWASAAVAAPKKGGFCLGSNNRAVDKQILKVPGVMLKQEEQMTDLRGMTYFGRLDIL